MIKWFDKLFTASKGGLLLMILVMVLSLMLGTAIADLSKSKAVGFMGVDYSSDLGNTTGVTTGVVVSPKLTAEFPDEVNCFFSIQNTSGVIVANTATVNIETSYNGGDWDIFQTVSAAASVVTGVRNTGATNTPFGRYWRMNITAIQNANASFVSGQCLFE